MTPAALAASVLARLVDGFDLRERQGPSRGPAAMLVGAGDLAATHVGSLRFYEGRPLERLVAIDVSVKPLQAEWRGTFAFAPARSLLPHLFLVFGREGGELFWLLDLLPRVDLGAAPSVVQSVYEPLSVCRSGVHAWPELRPGLVGPPLATLLSPWHLAHCGSSLLLPRLGQALDVWLEHWLTLVELGVPDDDPGSGAPDLRDRRVLGALWEPRTDPTAALLLRLVGVEQAQWIRAVLRGEI